MFIRPVPAGIPIMTLKTACATIKGFEVLRRARSASKRAVASARTGCALDRFLQAAGAREKEGHGMSEDEQRAPVAESRKELFERQTAEQYEQIGRFVVEFEKACAELRYGIIFLLHCDGLKTQRLAQILIDNKSMSAGPLIEAYEAITTEVGVRTDPIQKDVLEQVSKEFRKLMGERNRIVHGHWFIGYAAVGDPDFSEIGGLKGKPSKKEGMSFQHLPESVEEIADLVERASGLSELLRVTNARLIHGGDWEVGRATL